MTSHLRARPRPRAPTVLRNCWEKGLEHKKPTGVWVSKDVGVIVSYVMLLKRQIKVHMYKILSANFNLREKVCDENLKN